MSGATPALTSVRRGHHRPAIPLAEWPGAVYGRRRAAHRRPQAIQHWEQNTRIRFVERTAANAAQFPNWVSFEAQDGCFSSVGMQGNGHR